jgi:hypothetical protein
MTRQVRSQSVQHKLALGVMASQVMIATPDKAATRLTQLPGRHNTTIRKSAGKTDHD